MTKTFTVVISHRISKSGLPVVMQLLNSLTDRFGILNLGHCDLFEVWFLVLGFYMLAVHW